MAYGGSYGMAGVNKGFLEQMMKQNQGEKEAGAATTEQKKEMQAKFQAELEAAQAKARKKSKKLSGLGKVLDVAGMFMGPLGAGLSGGINALLQGNQAKKGAESLMHGVDSKRWGNTFMSEGMDSYKKEVDDSQMSTADMLGGALMSGVGSFAMSKAGGAEEGGSFKDIFKPGEDMVEGATNASFGEGTKGVADFKAGGIDDSLSMFGEKSANFDALSANKNLTDGAVSKNWGNKFEAGGGGGEGFLPKNSGSFDAFGKNKLGGMPSQIRTPGKVTPLKNLIGGAKDSFKQMTGNFSEEGLKGMDYQEMMKMMNMMQKMGGQ